MSEPRREVWISPSALDLYRRCPAAWQARYVQRRFVPGGPAALRGKLVHAAIAILLTAGAGLARPAVEAAFAAAADRLAVEECVAAEVAAEFVPANLGAVDHIEIVERWWHVSDGPRFSLPGSQTGFRGIRDAVRVRGGRVEVIDWKTGRYDRRAVRDASSTLLYGLAAAIEWGVDALDVVYRWPLTGRAVRIGWTADEARAKLAKACADASKMADAVRGDQGAPPEVSGWYCRFCDVRWTCETFQRQATRR